jgi:hypothetical protein
MSQTLAQLIANVQALFIDDGTNFTTALCTAAIRQSLKDFNEAAPRHAAEVFEAVSGQYEYELTDTTCLNILDVLQQGTDTLAEQHIKLDYNPYFEDVRPFFRLHVTQSSGYIICRYTIPHTVQDLDSEVESTLPAQYDPILIDGACYRCALARAAGRIEPINLNRDVQKLWMQIAKEYHDAFENGLIIAGRHQAPDQPKEAGWPV